MHRRIDFHILVILIYLASVVQISINTPAAVSTFRLIAAGTTSESGNLLRALVRVQYLRVRGPSARLSSPLYTPLHIRPAEPLYVRPDDVCTPD